MGTAFFACRNPVPLMDLPVRICYNICIYQMDRKQVKAMKKIASRLAALATLLLVLCSMTLPAFASGQTTDNTSDGDKELQYYLGTPVNAGWDTGYSRQKDMTQNDPHFGWTLGKFFVSGHTRVTEDENGDPVFLKTVGDTVTLWFHLEQDIDQLDGKENLTIAADTNGSDTYFGVEKGNFGRGTLIVRHRDYQNNWDEPVVYTNYLSANAETGADTQVELFEEGDYEVALDYEIKDSKAEAFGVSLLPMYSDYRIFFRFSVRNGNCMVYPFDVKTKTELTNTAVTENGFYLDLAKSRYLDIDIKKEVLQEGADGLTEDVRFNRPEKDGDCYTEEGIYTITVSNRYTGQQTQKKLYVGTDNLLKAYVTTGLSIQEIRHQVEKGAEIGEDGTIQTKKHRWILPVLGIAVLAGIVLVLRSRR